MKEFARRLIPEGIWRRLRRWRILLQHRRTGRICNNLISRHIAKEIHESLPEARKKIVGKKIIWQYWGQGFDDAPEVVSICLESVERYKGDCVLIRLTDESYKEYIEFPEYVENNRARFPKAFFSDLLRCSLLSAYGGVWLDATVLLTGPLPERYFDMDFFMYQRDPSEKDKRYWESTYAHYFGYYKGFKVNVLNSIFFARQSSQIVTDLTKLLLYYWETHNRLIHYFLFQIMFNEYIERFPERNCPIESDCTPHILQQMINAGYDRFSLEQLLDMTHIHKLSYKNKDAADRLKSVLPRLDMNRTEVQQNE